MDGDYGSRTRDYAQAEAAGFAGRMGSPRLTVVDAPQMADCYTGRASFLLTIGLASALTLALHSDAFGGRAWSGAGTVSAGQPSAPTRTFHPKQEAAVAQSTPLESLMQKLEPLYTWSKLTLKAAISPFLDIFNLVELGAEIKKSNDIIKNKQKTHLVELWYEELRTTPIDKVIRDMRGTLGLPGLSTQELKYLLEERAEKENINVKY